VLVLREDGVTRRRFLEELGMIALGCSAGCATLSNGLTYVSDPSGRYSLDEYKHIIYARRRQKHSYNLPDEYDVRHNNLTALLINLEHEFGKKGSIKHATSDKTRKYALERFEKMVDEFGERVPLEYVHEGILNSKILQRQNMSGKSANWFANFRVETVLARLHSVIIQERGFNKSEFALGRHSDFRLSDKNGVDYLTEMFLTGKYDCDTYSITALGIAERHGLPLRAVFTPEHMFLRWKSPYITTNFDMGKQIDDWNYSKGIISTSSREIPKESIDCGVYLEEVTKLETAAYHLATIGKGLLQGGEYSAALDVIKLAAKWGDTNPAVHYTYGTILWMMGYFDNAKAQFDLVYALDNEYFHEPVRLEHLRRFANANWIRTSL
jgi:hypothetical protein